MLRNASSKLRLRRKPTHRQPADQLERWKSIASIASAVAIPFVLAIVGYYIQKQLANDGLKKDYVSIAAGILKEKSEGQEPEVRKWAVDVLDKYSPIAFSDKARISLEQGIPLIMEGPAIVPPISDCMVEPRERTIMDALETLEKDISGLKQIDNAYQHSKAFLLHYMKFVEAVIDQEQDAYTTRLRLTCMQDWAKLVIDGDNKWRKYIGAPDSASVFEKIRNERLEAERTSESAKQSEKQKP